MSTVEYRIERTLQTAPFESIKITVGTVSEVREGEDEKAALKRVFPIVEGALDFKLRELASDS